MIDKAQTKFEMLQEKVAEWEALVKTKTAEMERDAQDKNYARAFYLQTQIEFFQERIMDIKYILNA